MGILESLIGGTLDNHELTSEHVRHLAGKLLRDPASASHLNIQQLAGSVMAHIERHDREYPRNALLAALGGPGFGSVS